jgi:hypothetical protein
MPKVCIQNVLLHAVKQYLSWTRCTQAVNSYASHSIANDSPRAKHFACVETLCVLPLVYTQFTQTDSVRAMRYVSALKKTVPDCPFSTQVDGAFSMRNCLFFKKDSYWCTFCTQSEMAWLYILIADRQCLACTFCLQLDIAWLYTLLADRQCLACTFCLQLDIAWLYTLLADRYCLVVHSVSR